MALLNFCGFETGNMVEANTTGGTAPPSAQTAPFAKNGTYGLLHNVVAAAGYARFRGYGANGKDAALGRTAATYYGFWFKPISSTGAVAVLIIRNTAGTEVTRLEYDQGSGLLQIPGWTNISVTTSTWYFVELLVISNSASCEWRVNGARVGAFTSANATQDYAQVGDDLNNQTGLFYLDDLYIDDARYLGPIAINVAVPTGDSATNTAWSASAGNKWACIDELPPSTADYIEALTTAGDRTYSATHASCATLGITGDIRATKVVARMWEPTSTTTLGAIGIRSGSTNFLLGNVDIGSTTVITMARVDSTDPNVSGAAWNRATVDAAEPLVRRSTSDTSNIRCGFLALMVLSAAAFVPGLTLSPIPTRRRML